MMDSDVLTVRHINDAARLVLMFAILMNLGLYSLKRARSIYNRKSLLV
jgi:hypothetical protein